MKGFGSLPGIVPHPTRLSRESAFGASIESAPKWLQMSSQLGSAGSSMTRVMGRKWEGEETERDFDKCRARLGAPPRELGRLSTGGCAFLTTLRVSFGIVGIRNVCTPLRSSISSSSSSSCRFIIAVAGRMPWLCDLLRACCPYADFGLALAVGARADGPMLAPYDVAEACL
jgi:hypothetical protein